MMPINQVILGGDPLLNSSALGNNLEEQIQMLERYKKNLENARQMQYNNQPIKLIWDDINSEIDNMSEEQKNRLYQESEYIEVYNQIQALVSNELLNLVKAKVENLPEGKELLNSQLKIVKRLKSKIINDTNMEIEIFKKFREYSKQNPEATYEEFLKSNI